MSTRLDATPIAKTADYTIVPDTYRSGTVFTNRGATTAVIFTLPTPSLKLMGWTYDFRGVANYNLTVQTASTKAVALNNAAATGVRSTETNKKIGTVITAFCDGASWCLNGELVGGGFSVFV